MALYQPTTIIIIAVLVLGLGFLANGILYSSGSLTPEGGANLFYVGENMTLNCHKNTNFATPEVTFKVGNDVIDQKYVTRINDTFARLVKPVTDADPAQARYFCIDSEVIGKRLVYTDYGLQNATDLDMVWLEKNDLYFTWKFGDVQYKNSHTKLVIQVSSQWRTVLNDDRYGSWRPCIGNNTSCTETDFNDIFATISFHVTIQNVKRGDSVSTIFRGLSVRDHGKPNPVELSNLEVLSSSSVQLTVVSSWSAMNYRISYCPVDHSPDKCGMTETGETTDRSLMVHALYPSYRYTFHVQAKFNTGGFFSDNSNAKIATMWEDG